MRWAAPAAATCLVPPSFFNSPDHKKRHLCSCFAFPWLLAPRAGWSEPPRPGGALPVLAGRRRCAGTCGCARQPGMRLVSHPSVCLSVRSSVCCRLQGGREAAGLAELGVSQGQKDVVLGETTAAEHRVWGMRSVPWLGAGDTAALLEHCAPRPAPVEARAERAPRPAPGGTCPRGAAGDVCLPLSWASLIQNPGVSFPSSAILSRCHK